VTQVSGLIQQIAVATGAEVVFKSNCFEMHGLEHEIRAAVMMIMELDIVKVSLFCSQKTLGTYPPTSYRLSTTKYGFKSNFPTNTANL
jgi:hypothetical protein